jgi:hypothetical protein
MANLDDILREKTYKDQGLDLGRRVFYTLATPLDGLTEEANQKLQAARNSKAVTKLIEHLTNKGLMSAEELDDILLHVVHS